VAPTLNPEELGKRIEELRTVQYWLEQNARMLGATIQALEVQRMTLSTLKTMNVQMNDLRDSLLIPMPTLAAAPEGAKASAAAAPARPAPMKPEPEPAAAEAAKAAPPAGVDPMQWWGALTKQFTELATAAMKEGATGAASNLTGAVPKPPAEGSVKTPRTSTARPAAKAARKAASRKRSGT
jgi:hypothetical protein